MTTTDLIEEHYEFLSSLSLQAARPVRRQYRMIEEQDLIQVGLLWCVQHPRKLREYLESDRRVRERLIVTSLRNSQKDYARRQRAAIGGYELSDEVWYSFRSLKGSQNGTGGLLHHVFDPEMWLRSSPDDDQPRRSPGDPAEGHGWLATLVDVQRAVDRLGPVDRWLIEARYKHGLTYTEIGHRSDPVVRKSAAAKRCDRAVARVQGHLGGFRPRFDPPEEGDWGDGPGSRRVMSNARARAITGAQYDD